MIKTTSERSIMTSVGFRLRATVRRFTTSCAAIALAIGMAPNTSSAQVRMTVPAGVFTYQVRAIEAQANYAEASSGAFLRLGISIPTRSRYCS